MARVISYHADPFTGERRGRRRSRPHIQPPVLADGPSPTEPMPNGDDIADLFRWVGYDPQRAMAALVAEHDRDNPRPEVISHLESTPTRESTP